MYLEMTNVHRSCSSSSSSAFNTLIFKNLIETLHFLKNQEVPTVHFIKKKKLLESFCT